MPDPTEPFEGYDDLNVGEVVALLAGYGEEDVATIKEYEAANENRKTIMEWERPAPPQENTQEVGEPFQPEGRPTAREVAEEAAANQRVEEAPNFGEEQ